jgi:hypothetical protein
MQKMLLTDAMNPKTPARERAQVARAWTDLEDQKRKIKMKPTAKPVDADKYKEQRKKQRRFYAPRELDETSTPTENAGSGVSLSPFKVVSPSPANCPVG